MLSVFANDEPGLTLYAKAQQFDPGAGTFGQTWDTSSNSFSAAPVNPKFAMTDSNGRYSASIPTLGTHDGFIYVSIHDELDGDTEIGKDIREFESGDPIDGTTVLARAVESELIDDNTGQAFRQELADRIAADWIASDASPVAIASALVTNPTFAALVATANGNSTGIGALQTSVTANGTAIANNGTAIAAIPGGGTTTPRVNYPIAKAFVLPMSRRSDGTVESTKPVVCSAGDKAAFALDFAPLFTRNGISRSGPIVTEVDTLVVSPP